MLTKIDEIYDQVIRVLPSSDRLRLATLILNKLVQQESSVIDDPDTYDEKTMPEDVEDFCLNRAMDEAALTPLFGREAALQFLEDESA